MVLIAIEDCGATLNLTSLSWTLLPLPMNNGILFNDDWTHKSVYYISSHNDTQSHVYMVLIVHFSEQGLLPAAPARVNA